MKALIFVFVGLLAGCATVPAARTRADYIIGLRQPVTLKAYYLILDGGSGSLQLADASGREVSIYQDCSGANHAGRKKSRHGREIGDVVLEDLSSGRVVDYAGTEGAKLLAILDALKPIDADEARGVRLFADFIRSKRKEPNQSPEPTTAAGTSAAEQPLVPAAVVAHL